MSMHFPARPRKSERDQRIELLSHSEWLPDNDLARDDWHWLRVEIDELRREGDTFKLIGPAEPWAVKRNIALRDELRRRPPPEADPEVAASIQRDRALDRRWNEFIGDLGRLRAELAGKRHHDLIVEWLGLESGDLNDPTDPGNWRYGGKRARWAEVAGRVGDALSKWDNVPADRRWLVPVLATVEHDHSAIASLEKQVADLSATLEKLQPMIAALEKFHMTEDVDVRIQ